MKANSCDGKNKDNNIKYIYKNNFLTLSYNRKICCFALYFNLKMDGLLTGRSTDITSHYTFGLNE